MNCADLETLLCEYIDGTLAPEPKTELEQHLARCAGCAELARDAAAAAEFLQRVEAVEPPPELLTRILFELPSGHHARPRQPNALSRLARKWFQPVLQPRFAMGFAMTILSFSLLGRFAGISPRQLTLDDLRPAKIWQAADDRIYRAWQRTVKFYENLRFVYEIQQQLREWNQKARDERTARTGMDEQPAAEAPAAGTSGAGPRNRK
jgi:anti-sigma factor RsiW